MTPTMNEFDVPDPPKNEEDESTKWWNNHWNKEYELLGYRNEGINKIDEPYIEFCQRPDCLMPLPHEHGEFE